MNTININFSDFTKEFKMEDNYFYNLLKKKYKIKISDHPDFLISSVYGMDYLNYDCVRILYTGENITPNFNLFDYAIGFDWMKFEDRYLRLPLYYIRNNSFYYQKCKSSFNFEKKDIENRKFCNFIYSNAGADNARTDFFYILSKYKFIHSGGKYLNNIDGRVENKNEFQQQFKFSIAFENSSTNGYTTEKIIEAKAAGTVPIYWGNPVIGKEMNSNAFINCHNYNSFNAVVDYIKYLENNLEEYLKILNEPLIKSDIYDLNDAAVLNFFDNIIQKNNKMRSGQPRQVLEKKFKQYQKLEKFKRTKAVNYLIEKLGL